MKKILLWALLPLLLGSCDNSEDTGGFFSLDVLPTTAALVPAARKSCTDVEAGTETFSVSSPSVAWRSFRLSWQDTTRDLFIAKIQLQLPPNMNNTRLDIATETELNALFGIDGAVIRRAGTSGNPTGNIWISDSVPKPLSKPPCSLAFGGVLAEPNQSFTASAKILMLGVAFDDFGNEQVVRATTEVSIIVDTK